MGSTIRQQAPLASYNAERPGTIDSCSSQTRVDLLEKINDWIADPGSDPIYWLKERAGFGKTAIALSVAERAAERGELAASFFFSHQVSYLNNASLFFRTITFQLALFNHRRYRQTFAEAVRDFPNASAAKLKHQVEALFVKPLRQVEQTTQPLVIVIDALDECNREHAQKLVEVLTDATKAIPLPLRLFITSRPEHHIITAFEASDVSSRTVADTSYADVETYLRQELPDIPRKLGLRGMSRDWITEEEIIVLVTLAGGLFIYASTVIRFIGYPTALNPRKRLDILLRDDESKSATYQPYRPLDRLYRRVLDLATDGQPDLEEEVLVVLGACTVINGAPSLPLLACLLSLEADDDHRTVVRLQSVVQCPESDSETVAFHHASFKDFLVDRSRSGSVYFIDTPIYHRRLALRSMQILTQLPLRTYIENLVTRADYVLYKLTEEQQLPVELGYAVEGIFLHTVKAHNDVDLVDAFDEWLQACYPWWFEIYGFNAKFIREACAWRAEKGTPSTILSILKGFAALQPADGNPWTEFFDCCTFARKELRRYFRAATKYPGGLDDDTDSRVASLHDGVRECIHRAEDRGVHDSNNTDTLAFQGAMTLAQELEGVIDDFTLSVGDDDEVRASRRSTAYMRSQLRDTLIGHGAIQEELPLEELGTVVLDETSEAASSLEDGNGPDQVLLQSG